MRGSRARHGHHRSGALGYGPYFYPDYETEEGEVSVPSGQVVPQAAPAAVALPTKAADAIVMELRGDHWVRLTSTGPTDPKGMNSGAAPGSADAVTDSDAASSGKRSSATKAFDTPAQPPTELAPAVLIFRDGHREQIAQYTIVGGVIQIKADYWSDGRWTRAIKIAELDVPATLKENEARGTHFALPSRPGEVMMRP